MLNETFKILGIILAGTTGISTLAYFLFQTAVRNFSDRNLERFKDELMYDARRHKLQLDKNLFEYQNKMSRLYSDRADAIKKIFVLLNRADNAIHNLLTPVRWSSGEKKEELAEKTRITVNDFILCFEENEILVSDHTIVLLYRVKEIYLKAWGEYQATEMVTDANNRAPAERIKEQIQFYFSELEGKIPQLKEALKKEFKRELGSDLEHA